MNAALNANAVTTWGDRCALLLLIGAVIYLIGAILVTIAVNVPLNNLLAGVDPGSSAGASFWARYLKDWTLWNHVRTVASGAAFALYVAAIATRQS